MHIAVGSLQFPMSHQIFEVGKGHAFVHFMCSKGVAQRVNTGPFLDTGFLHMLFDNVAHTSHRQGRAILGNKQMLTLRISFPFAQVTFECGQMIFIR